MDLTVAICMYNAEKYVEETLECLTKQTRRDFNLLIVNDCSTDKSVDKVKEYYRRNPREYSLVTLPKNGGLCAGRRYVEDNVRTKYLLFVDADDRPLPTFVEKLYDKITSDPDLIAVGCHLGYINMDGKKINGGIFIGETTKDGFKTKASKAKLIFMASTSIYNREIALSVGGHNVLGFPEGKPRYQDLCEDLDLWTRMSDLYKEGLAIVVIPEILYEYRKGDGMSMSSFGMLLRMRHIKTNLKRRRRGEKELTFIEFSESLSESEINALKKEAKAADNLRVAYYSIKKGNVFKGLYALGVSVTSNPRYFYDKFKHNILRKK